jgi:hypothetical protein
MSQAGENCVAYQVSELICQTELAEGHAVERPPWHADDHVDNASIVFVESANSFELLG